MNHKQTSPFVDRVIERLDRLDREQIENLLRTLGREREFLGDIFDRLTEGVLVCGPNWEILRANQAAVRLMGLEKQRRLIGERLFDLPLDDGLMGLLRSYVLKPSGADRRQEITAHKPAEAILSVFLIGGSAREPSGALKVVILEDVTETRIEQLRRQQAEKIASLATLTAGVAHDIKNPLNSLKIHAQLLNRIVREPDLDDSARERIRRSLGIILEEINRLGGVVEQFLAAARPTQPELRAQRMDPVIERLADLIRPEMDQKKIELVLDLDSELVEIQMDASQMIQALMNVVRNAIEAIEVRRVDYPQSESRIEIRTRSDKNNAWILISDTGCGIAQTDLKRIAEPYYTTKFSGTGLGLMVVYRVAREHGGTLHIQSELNAGTTITIQLPLKRRLPRSLTLDSATAQNGSKSGAPATEHNTAP
ncbi:MAG: ATP-binding protein [Candidatus Sumerlaeota bacterium]|nr:ATP-binding protein [Candidatus Sumerlaeota bacterium]